MANPKDDQFWELLEPAFLACCRGEDPGDLAWMDRFDHDFPNDRGGSDNIAALKNAVRLFRQETRARALAAWAWWFERNQVAFENVEPGSRIYRHLTCEAILLALRKLEGELAAAARNWLRLYWTVERLSIVQRPFGIQTMRCGYRSAGHALLPAEADFLDALAFQRPFRWTKPWRYKQNSTWSKAAELLRPEIEATAAAVRAAPMPDLVIAAPHWGSIVATHYYRTDHGVAVWVERQAGQNTLGLAAMGCDEGGEPWSLPGEHGRVRDKKNELLVLEQDGLLRFSGHIEGTPLREETRPLPGGTLLYHVIHNAAGLRMRGAAVEPPAPAPAPQPSRGPVSVPRDVYDRTVGALRELEGLGR